MYKLLLLDINGLLCCKKNNHKIILRPYYKEFLDFCYLHFNVGFFTSTTEKNAKLILNQLLTQEQFNQTTLMLFRQHTHRDYESYKIYDTIKNLNDVYDTMYHDKNTILIDDSPEKVRYNNPKNIIICETFKGDENDNHLIELMHKIVEQFEFIKL